jgi:hypothetical protein
MMFVNFVVPGAGCEAWRRYSHNPYVPRRTIRVAQIITNSPDGGDRGLHPGAGKDMKFS